MLSSPWFGKGTNVPLSPVEDEHHNDHGQCEKDKHSEKDDNHCYDNGHIAFRGGGCTGGTGGLSPRSRDFTGGDTCASLTGGKNESKTNRRSWR